MSSKYLEAFNRAYSEKIRLEEKKSDQQLMFLLKELEMNHQNQLYERDLKDRQDQHNAGVYAQYADNDVENINGWAVPKDDADISETLRMREQLYGTNIEYLQSMGLNTTGTEDEIASRVGTHRSAYNRGLIYTHPSMLDEAGLYKVDTSPDMLTHKDISDARDMILEQGYENPIVLNSLVNAGVIDRSDLYTTPEGFPTLTDSNGNLDQGKLDNLKIAFEGFAKGLILIKVY